MRRNKPGIEDTEAMQKYSEPRDEGDNDCSQTPAPSKPALWVWHGERYDCVYSPNNNGYYLQRHADDATSQVFVTPSLAMNALRDDRVTWESEDV